MEEFALIDKMPKRFSGVRVSDWASEASCMIHNADWDTRPHYLVGIDEVRLYDSSLAFYHVMKARKVPAKQHLFTDVRQVISESGLKAMGAGILSGYHPETFFDLIEGGFAIPMGDTLETIEKAYDAGEPIWIVQLKFKG